MIDFDQNGYVLIKNFLDETAVQTVSRYIEYSLNQGFMPRDNNKEAPSHRRYGDPLTETILYNSKEHIENVTGKKLYPTYSFSRVYLKGDELKPHVDRPACEISVTCHVATQGDPWPIWMKAPGKEPIYFVLEPGDAVVYKGCEVTHWREKAINTAVNAQFMLHYVDQNGPYVEHKFDKRVSLGTLHRGI